MEKLNELKIKAYDLLVAIQHYQTQLQHVNQEMAAEQHRISAPKENLPAKKAK